MASPGNGDESGKDTSGGGQHHEDDSPFSSPNQRRAFEELSFAYGDHCNYCGERGHWQSECPRLA